MFIFVSRTGVTKPPVELGVDKKSLEKKDLLCYTESGLATAESEQGGIIMKDDIRSLSHSKWRCKYHIVFAPKYRRQIIYRQLRVDIGKIVRDLCERKGVEILEAECCPNHIHMLVAIPPHLSVAGFMGYLKSKSSLMIFDRHANLKYKYGNRHFWCRGYYVDTVGKYENAIKDYIKNQLQDDIMNDQISMKELIDPFTGEQEKKGK